MTKHKKTQIVIDANEANIDKRVGSNVYAFEIIKSIYELARQNKNLQFTILLRNTPVLDMPLQHSRWQYKIIRPNFLWTQFAEPIYLFLNAPKFNVFFTPSHYAPRNCPVPYVSSVMDLAFLNYPDQFTQKDLIKLEKWTKYSVNQAKKIVTISAFTKRDVIQKYHRVADDIVIAYPAIKKITPASKKKAERFFKKHHLKEPYFLFLGTIQPRKNLVRLLEAYEQLCRRLSSQQLKKKKKKRPELPQLVLAGKIGWLAEPILERFKKSPFFENIIFTGYVPENIKPHLYKGATASLLLGLHEGFGIPPLESLEYGCIPIVADTTSLPEVVGEAGFKVNPYNVKKISQAMEDVLTMPVKEQKRYQRKARHQVKKFNWQKPAEKILDTLLEVASQNKKG